MKINKIAALVKKEGRICLLDAPDKTQWVGDGSAFYPLFGLPYLEEENLYTIFDINEKQKRKMIFTHTDLPTILNFSDTASGENRIKEEKINIGFHGKNLMPFQVQQGIEFINTAYFAPFMNDFEDLAFFERISENGQFYIAVKKGLMLIGLILPYNLVDADFIEDMEDLLEQCRLTYRTKKSQKALAFSEQTEINIDENS